MSASLDKVYAIILAAGASTRLGSPKQLLEWRNQSLLAHTLQNVQVLLGKQVYVVLGAHAAEIQSALALDKRNTVINANWEEGIASSIRAGVNALPASASAVLILLCDQPLINTRHLQQLLKGWQSATDKIVASQYPQSVGVPALFPARYFEQLLTLSGDRGARSLFKAFETNLQKIPIPEAEFDIDYKEDFDRLLRLTAAEDYHE
ncbi:nucleotidyltransferase family protein [Methylomonas sp. AM2-LC]|uniref:nucleotidyltransferase family protein n=1 Tax=Methylomonas sp. AM2-LC TaxID=3153301 RepID=UPI0032665560